MKKKYSNMLLKIILPLLFIVFFALLLAPRFLGVSSGLPDYYIDDPAVGIFTMKYLLGDFDPGFYQYGPLYSYILAFAYFLFSFFSSTETSTHIYNYFFNPYDYYLMTRISSTVVIIAIAFLASYFSNKLYNKKVAVTVLFLAVFPFIDNLIDYHVKIDTLQAICSLFTVYFSIKINQTGQLKYYILTGLFIGLSFSTKPLPALLILPTVFLSHLLIKNNLSGIKIIISNIFHKNLLILGVSSIFSSFLFNPYLFVRLRSFFEAHARIMVRDTHLTLPNGEDFLLILTSDEYLGFFFVITAIIAACYFIYKFAKTKNISYLIIVSYPIIFWLAFAFLPARPHFFVPIIPFFFIMISKLIVDIADKIKYLSLKFVFISVVFILLILRPSIILYHESLFLKAHHGLRNSISTVAAKDWVEKNVPPMSKIFMDGYYAGLPRLVNIDIEKHMDFDEAFAYGHDDNEKYANKYRDAYNLYKNNGGIFYDIENSHGNHQTEWEKLGYENDFMFEYCTKNNFDYVISISDLDRFPEFKKRKITEFDIDDYPIGDRFQIYKLK